MRMECHGAHDNGVLCPVGTYGANGSQYNREFFANNNNSHYHSKNCQIYEQLFAQKASLGNAKTRLACQAGFPKIFLGVAKVVCCYFFIQRDGAIRQKTVSAAEKKTFTVGMVMPNRVQSILSHRMIGCAISCALRSANDAAPL